MIYLLRALMDGVEELHCHLEAVCCEVVQKGSQGSGRNHINPHGPAPLDITSGRGFHLFCSVINKQDSSKESLTSSNQANRPYME